MDKLLKNQKEKLLHHWRENGIITDSRLLEAFFLVSREDFLPEKQKSLAYGDHPLPISCGQTISQPTTVMMMCQALDVEPGMKVLEIGAGSGYQAAILSKLAGDQGKVIAIEYHSRLAASARSALEEAGCRNVRVIHGDGGPGFEEEAPFDRIIAACGCPRIPEAWICQLKTGGIMVVPLSRGSSEDMRVIRKTGDGLRSSSLGAFTFVPLLGRFGA